MQHIDKVVSFMSVENAMPGRRSVCCPLESSVSYCGRHAENVLAIKLLVMDFHILKANPMFQDNIAIQINQKNIDFLH